MFDTQQDVQVRRRLERAMALPIYTLALILSFLSDAHWPRRSPATIECR
jgi:hypothetical protein